MIVGDKSKRMNLELAPYKGQSDRWPKDGRHILAQYDDSSIIVYQAYRPSIGNFAAERGYFGGEFRLNRMSWIKPNFLWMMYRSGWGTKPEQEVVLAVRIYREFFEAVLDQAISSSYEPDIYPNREAWRTAVTNSSVRLQWDPAHHPSGAPLKRKAIQLGLRGNVLKKYARDAICEIINISEFVASQRQFVTAEQYSILIIPREQVYVPADSETIDKLNLSHYE